MIDHWIKRIEAHNKYPQRARILNRDRIVLERRGWGRTWMMYLHLQGEWQHHRFIADPTRPWDVCIYGQPHLRVDPIERMLSVGTGWIGHYNVYLLNACLPRGVRIGFEYATRKTPGQWVLYGADKRTLWVPRLVLHITPDNKVQVVDGALAPREAVPTDSVTRARMKRTMQYIRDTLLPYDALRRSAPLDHPMFSYESLRKLDASTAQLLPALMHAAETNADYDPQLHAGCLRATYCWNQTRALDVPMLYRRLFKQVYSQPQY